MQVTARETEELYQRLESLQRSGRQTIADDLDFLAEQVDLMPVTPPRPLISLWAGEKRILPSSTPFPGPYDPEKTPYSIEIMDNMSPHSPVIHQCIMKGVQLGLTTAAENVIAYYMSECPSEILYVTATENLLKRWAGKRLEPLIDSCGIRSRITAQTDNPKSRRTGDLTLSKAFVGGNLDMASAQSASSLRSDSKKILIRDEIDGAPQMLATGEGNWLSVSKARTDSFGVRRKIMDFSTPTTVEKSEILIGFSEGDQRKYLMPCPMCKKYQELEYTSDKAQHGFKAETKAGKLVRGYYICDHCHDAIFNHHKTAMLKAGRWEPMAVSHDESYRSYQISSLYSPVGMLDWTELWRRYQKAQDRGPDGMRDFVPLYQANAYKETGSRPKLENVIELRGGYREKTIPDGVLYLTMGIDVQSGSKRDSGNPARLEIEILGIGAGYRTWSILYRRFEGEVDDPWSGAWEKMNKWAEKGGMVFKRKDGREFSPSIVFADSGDGNLTDVVYRFTTRWGNTFASKGFSALRRNKSDKKDVGDVAGPSNFRRYRPVKLSAGQFLYEISTNYYKTHVYNNLKIPRLDVEPQRAGFCDFPVDRSESYFRMLTAEEKRGDGSFHCPSGRRNEALDCRVMALCAADAWLDNRLLEVKAAVKAGGGNPVQVAQINHRAIIDQLGLALDPKRQVAAKKKKR